MTTYADKFIEELIEEEKMISPSSSYCFPLEIAGTANEAHRETLINLISEINALIDKEIKKSRTYAILDFTEYTADMQLMRLVIVKLTDKNFTVKCMNMDHNIYMISWRAQRK